jgi:hypothetical protein
MTNVSWTQTPSGGKTVTRMSTPTVSPPAMVDLDRYPVRDLGCTRAQQMLAQTRAALVATGAAELAGFLTPEGVRAVVEDAEKLAPRAHRSSGLGTAYLEMPGLALPQEHPRRWIGPYSVRAVAYDLIPHWSPLRLLYEWNQLAGLIAAILGRGPIYRYADPFGALNLAIMAEGDQLQWHFDQADFVVSLAIQSAELGGDFEVAPLVRAPDNENYPVVGSVLAGDRARVVTLPMTPGTLLIFEGRHSLHRVSPIKGSRLRHVGLLAYDTKPGTVGSDLLRMDRYGRTEPFPEPPT